MLQLVNSELSFGKESTPGSVSRDSGEGVDICEGTYSIIAHPLAPKDSHSAQMQNIFTVSL